MYLDKVEQASSITGIRGGAMSSEGHAGSSKEDLRQQDEAPALGTVCSNGASIIPAGAARNHRGLQDGAYRSSAQATSSTGGVMIGEAGTCEGTNTKQVRRPKWCGQEVPLTLA